MATRNVVIRASAETEQAETSLRNLGDRGSASLNRLKTATGGAAGAAGNASDKLKKLVEGGDKLSALTGVLGADVGGLGSKFNDLKDSVELTGLSFGNLSGATVAGVGSLVVLGVKVKELVDLHTELANVNADVVEAESRVHEMTERQLAQYKQVQKELGLTTEEMTKQFRSFAEVSRFAAENPYSTVADAVNKLTKANLDSRIASEKAADAEKRKADTIARVNIEAAEAQRQFAEAQRQATDKLVGSLGVIKQEEYAQELQELTRAFQELKDRGITTGPPMVELAERFRELADTAKASKLENVSASESLARQTEIMSGLARQTREAAGAYREFGRGVAETSTQAKSHVDQMNEAIAETTRQVQASQAANLAMTQTLSLAGGKTADFVKNDPRVSRALEGLEGQIKGEGPNSMISSSFREFAELARQGNLEGAAKIVAALEQQAKVAQGAGGANNLQGANRFQSAAFGLRQRLGELQGATEIPQEILTLLNRNVGRLSGEQGRLAKQKLAEIKEGGIGAVPPEFRAMLDQFISTGIKPGMDQISSQFSGLMRTLGGGVKLDYNKQEIAYETAKIINRDGLVKTRT